jgi:hypothetical protein
MAQTNHYWNKLSEDDILWKPHCITESQNRGMLLDVEESKKLKSYYQEICINQWDPIWAKDIQVSKDGTVAKHVGESRRLFIEMSYHD